MICAIRSAGSPAPVVTRALDRVISEMRRRRPLAPSRGTRRTCSRERVNFEFACCLLSSQVTWEVAVAAARRLRARGLLRSGSPPSRADCASALMAPLEVGEARVRYRFPNIKATQLAASLKSGDADATLNDLAVRASRPVCLEQAYAIRSRVAATVHGLGLKQSSMLLRNLDVSHDLAIVDRHVIRFIQLLEIDGADWSSRPLSVAQYERAEAWLRSFAETKGCRVAELDLAIWISMRAAREEGIL